MKSYFYERTGYKLNDKPAPSCFLHLDEHFDRSPALADTGVLHLPVLLAESICGRIADVEFYVSLMEEVRKRQALEKGGDIKAAVRTRSYLLGYLGVARSLLDSGAMTLALLYTLPIQVAERTFRHAEFWQQLATLQPHVHRRYHPSRLFFQEVFRWCDESVVRIPPLLASHHHFGPFSNREMHLRALDQTELDLPMLTREPLRLTWLDPLALHDRWRPHWQALCEKLCQDIAAHV
jgi:hypothetical protein